MKKVLCVILLLLVIIFSYPIKANASDFDKSEYNEYLSQYDLSSFKNQLDEDTYSALEELNLHDFDFESIESLSFEDVSGLIISIIAGKSKTPIKGAISVLAFIILTSLLQGLKNNDESMNNTYSVASAVIISVLLVVEISNTASIACSSISVASSFIYAFLPVFCAIVIASGGVTTAFSTNSTLIMLSQGLSFIASNIFLPLINCFLALGVCSSLSPEIHLEKLISGVKQAITSAISFVAAVFVSILSIKTSVAARADVLGIRSIRLVINTVVPVIGASISEGLLSIQGYSSLIKNSVGIVGIIAIALVFLPSIIEVVIWRITLSVCVIAADVFNEKTVSNVLTAFRDAMLLINVILILSMLTTAISIGVLVAAHTG
ncbi:MAG: hypothetical protein ACI4IG_03330 [Eubacterium sp.]